MGVAFAVSSVRVFVTKHVSVLKEVRVSVSVFVHVLLAGHMGFTFFSVGICISVISFNMGVIVINDHSVNNVSMGAGTMEVLNSMVVSIASFMRFTLFFVSISISIISFNVGVIVVNDHSVN